MSYAKDYPPQQPPYRESYHAPNGPPAYGHEPATDPFRDTPPPASRGIFLGPSEYDNAQYSGGESSQYYSSGQKASPPQTSSGPYLAPAYPPPAQRTPSPSRSPALVQNVSGPVTLLNPPPPSFMRAPAGQFPYSPFPPCTAISLGTGLDSGFPMLPPPAQVQPHPFMTHDVNEEDWVRFLGDVQRAGILSPMNKLVANIPPIILAAGF